MTEHRKIFGLSSSLVFWILLAILIAPSTFFIYRSFVKLDEVLTEIGNPPPSSFDDLMKLSAEQFANRAVYALERDVIAYRQHRATSALTTRTWMRFMSLVFGAILIVIGASFILGKITTPDASTGELTFGDIKGNFATSSPGLALIVLGSVLMLAPNFATQEIRTDDTSSFIAKSLPAAPAMTNPANTPEAQRVLERIREKYRTSNSTERDNP